MSSGPLGPGLGDDAHGPDPTCVLTAMAAFEAKADAWAAQAARTDNAIAELKADIAATQALLSQLLPMIDAWNASVIATGGGSGG